MIEVEAQIYHKLFRVILGGVYSPLEGLDLFHLKGLTTFNLTLKSS